MVNKTVKQFRQRRHQVLEQIHRLQSEAAKLGKAISLLTRTVRQRHAQGSSRPSHARTQSVWPEPPS